MSFDYASVKANFFDTKAVTDKLDPALRKALSKFGAFVRTRSKSSIKRHKGTSRQGQPPYAHEGSIKKILFSFDAKNNSVVIGPVLAKSQSGAPENLEYGGVAKVDGVTKTIGPRPFMNPAFDTELKNVNDDFKNLIK